MGRWGQHLVALVVAVAAALQGGCGESSRSATGAAARSSAGVTGAGARGGEPADAGDAGGSATSAGGTGGNGAGRGGGGGGSGGSGPTGGSRTSGGGGDDSGSGGGGSGSGGGAGTPFENPNALGTGELGACNAQGWCWQAPAPAGDLFFAISDDGRYAAGENGIVFEWPGTYLPSAGTGVVSFVQTAGDTVWAGGYGLWRYDGAEWISESTATLSALSVSPSGDVWALTNGEVRHLHAGTWTTEERTVPDSPKSLLADVIAVDDETTWVLATSEIDPKLPDDAKLTVLQLRAGSWSELPSDVKDSTGSWRFLRAGTRVYVYSVRQPGIYSPGEGWSLVAEAPLTSSYGVFAAPGGGLLAAGTDGVYTVGDPGGRLVSNESCRALVPVSDEEALCAPSHGGLVRIRPSAGPSEPLEHLAPELFGQVPTPLWAQAYVAWGSGPTDVWRPPLEHFDGASWTSVPGPDGQDFDAQLIDGSAPDNVWFYGGEELIRYDGGSFVSVSLPDMGSPVFLSALHTLSPTDTWIVRGPADSAHVLHYDGGGWTDTMSVDDSYAYARAAFAGGGATPLYAAVGPGLYRLVAGSWERVVSSSLSLVDVAVDGDELWVLGQDGVYQLVDGSLVERGMYSGGLEHLALTDQYVWHYWGTNARTLPR